MTLIWGGLATGAVYAVVAMGYNIVFIASGTFNFAHAQLLMVGTFIAYWGLAVLKWPAVAVFALAGLIVAVLAVIEERIAIRTVRSVDGQLVTTVGVASVLNGATQLIWGTGALSVPFMNSSQTWTLAGGRVSPVAVVLIVVTIVMTVALVYASRRAITGLLMLAMAEDRDAAVLRGINVRWLVIVAFALSGLVAGLLGPIVGANTFAVATLGTTLALYGFVAVAIGGFGSLGGGLVGGLVVGLVSQFAARYLGANYVDLAVFAVLLLILSCRPSGLFGRIEARAV